MLSKLLIGGALLLTTGMGAYSVGPTIMRKVEVPGTVDWYCTDPKKADALMPIQASLRGDSDVFASKVIGMGCRFNNTLTRQEGYAPPAQQGVMTYPVWHFLALAEDERHPGRYVLAYGNKPREFVD